MTPQADAGIRSEPPPSLPCATATMAAATAAADPPLEPPGERAGSQGLRVAPNAVDRVSGDMASSGVLVRPRNTIPAARSRSTRNAS